MGLGLPEVVIILLALGVLFFGATKITDIARSMGSASGEFKKAKRQVENELAGMKMEEEKQQEGGSQATQPVTGSDTKQS